MVIVIDKGSDNFDVITAMGLVKIGKVAEALGVTTKTLIAWERSGELVPDRRSRGGVRYYDLDKIRSTGLGIEDLPTIGYAHVSAPGQEASLSRQEELLEAFCAAKGWQHKILSDSGREPGPGSGPGAGFKRLLSLILGKRIRRLVLTHKDRLLRFGSEIILSLCELQGIEVVIINQGDGPPPFGEEELAQDIELRQLCERLVKDAGAGVDAGVDAGAAAGIEAGVPQAVGASHSSSTNAGKSSSDTNGKNAFDGGTE
jgi:predicted site-specific integrase-resolvase